ncbi:MAG: DUF4232 domain-containing protein [Clostridia bacterium]
MRSERQRPVSRVLLASVSGFLLVLALSGCGSPQAGSSGSSSSHPPSSASSSQRAASTSSAPFSGVASSSSVSGTGRCLSTNLSVSLVQSQGAAGSAIRTYEFTNEAANPCTLYGYPGFQLVASNGQNLPTTVIRSPASEATVTLQSGGHAWFTMQYPTQTGYGNLSCPTSASLEVTPPNAYHYVTVSGSAGTIQAYGGTTTNLQCGRINVQPVTGTPPSP